MIDVKKNNFLINEEVNQYLKNIIKKTFLLSQFYDIIGLIITKYKILTHKWHLSQKYQTIKPKRAITLM